MRQNIPVLFVLVCLGLAQAARPRSAAIKLALYYETLCPDTRAFVLSQLAPVYASFGPDAIDLELIPFGHGQVHPNGTITCQHGEPECYGNIVQGCQQTVPGASTGVAQSLSLVRCMFEKDNWRDTAATSVQCIAELDLDGAKINDCIAGPQGLEILKANADRTEALDPVSTWIPWVLIEDKHTAEMEEADFDLRSYLCTQTHLTDHGLEQCRSRAVGVAASLILVVSFLISRLFM